MVGLKSELAGLEKRVMNLLTEFGNFSTNATNIVSGGLLDSFYSLHPRTSKPGESFPFVIPLELGRRELDFLVSRLAVATEEEPSPQHLRQIYRCVQPAFRIIFIPQYLQHALDEINEDLIIDPQAYILWRGSQHYWFKEGLIADSISIYIKEQQKLVKSYSKKDVLTAETLYQEEVLRLMLNFFRGWDYILPWYTSDGKGRVERSRGVFLANELRNASPEIRAFLRDEMRTFQQLYETDVQCLFTQYRDLLFDIHRTLKGHVRGVEVYDDKLKRRIGSLGADAVSGFGDFVFGDKGLKIDQKQPLTGAKLRFARKLVKARDWGRLVQATIQYSRESALEETVPEIMREEVRLPFYRLVSTREDLLLEEARFREFPLRDIKGHEGNNDLLENLLRAYAQGGDINHILILGETGVGKSISFMAVARKLTRKFKDLRIFVAEPHLLAPRPLSILVEKYSKSPYDNYRIIVYIDDASWDVNEQYLKATLQGAVEFPSNMRIVASVDNKNIPLSIDRRFRTIEYKFDRGDRRLINAVFRVHCRQYGIPYDPGLYRKFLGQYGEKGRLREDTVLGHIDSFIRDEAALIKVK